MTKANEAGQKVCIISSNRPATEHRILSKEGATLVHAGYRVSIVALHPHDEMLSNIAIKGVPKFTSRSSRMMCAPWYVYRQALYQCADVYHLHDTALIPVGWLLKFHGKCVLYDVHED